MAVKGKSYIKTTWAFEERPVASEKLNSWDDRIEGALELVLNLVSMAWGGGDGVIRNATEQDLRVVATVPASMSVRVSAGLGFISRFPFRLGEAFNTAPMSAPVGNPRIDLVQARLDSWDVGVKTGVESSDPVAPVADEDCMALACVYLRPGMGFINGSDDTVNGYIIDARKYV